MTNPDDQARKVVDDVIALADSLEGTPAGELLEDAGRAMMGHPPADRFHGTDDDFDPPADVPTTTGHAGLDALVGRVRDSAQAAVDASLDEAVNRFRELSDTAGNPGATTPAAGARLQTERRLPDDWPRPGEPLPHALNHLAAAAEAMATRLVDAGHASWCPTCGGSGWTARTRPGPGRMDAQYGPCTRCRGGRLNPFHGCTFTAETPCTCTTTCRVYQPQETPTP